MRSTNKPCYVLLLLCLLQYEVTRQVLLAYVRLNNLDVGVDGATYSMRPVGHRLVHRTQQAVAASSVTHCRWCCSIIYMPKTRSRVGGGRRQSSYMSPLRWALLKTHGTRGYRPTVFLELCPRRRSDPFLRRAAIRTVGALVPLIM